MELDFSCFSLYFCSFFFITCSLVIFNCFRGEQVYRIVFGLLGVLTFFSLPDLLKIMIIFTLSMRKYP
jgi:hypothetical protein